VPPCHCVKLDDCSHLLLNAVLRACLQDDGTADDADTEQDNDTYYFNSYAHISIHETMLRVSAGCFLLVTCMQICIYLCLCISHFATDAT
jgi:hypothetical protein